MFSIYKLGVAHSCAVYRFSCDSLPFLFSQRRFIADCVSLFRVLFVKIFNFLQTPRFRSRRSLIDRHLEISFHSPRLSGSCERGSYSLEIICSAAANFPRCHLRSAELISRKMPRQTIYHEANTNSARSSSNFPPKFESAADTEQNVRAIQLSARSRVTREVFACEILQIKASPCIIGKSILVSTNSQKPRDISQTGTNYLPKNANIFRPVCLDSLSVSNCAVCIRFD